MKVLNIARIKKKICRKIRKLRSFHADDYSGVSSPVVRIYKSICPDLKVH
jgi:hypothetical protein